MIESISVQTLANVPSAAITEEAAEDTDDAADDAAEDADEAAEDAADEADDIVDDVDPPHAVTLNAMAAIAADARTDFIRIAIYVPSVGVSTGRCAQWLEQ